MYNVLVIESPGKQQKIQGYLGSKWKVVASLGHIRGLEENIQFLMNDFEPTYVLLKEKAKAIKQLKEVAKNAKEIYLAADKDMEGEQIAYSVCLVLKLDPSTVKRVTFSEITEKAITYALCHPGHIDMNRVYTQQCRAMLDILIGFTMSPLLWRYVGPSLSAGRCQIPSLRLVVEREHQISEFVSSSSYVLSAYWKTDSFSFESSMEDELEDEESVINYMESIVNTPEGTIVHKEIKKWTENPPQPFITSTLQQQSSARYHINPKNTMKIAQKLYEAGHITYMRTDTAFISEEAVNEAKQWIIENYGEEYVEEEKEEKKKDKKGKKDKKDKNVQEAHEAIRATHMNVTSIEGTVHEMNIYRLIWQRTIQSVMASAHGEICKIKTQIKDDIDFNWCSQWKHILFDGWKKVGKVVDIDNEEMQIEKDDGVIWNKVLALHIQDKVMLQNMKAESKDTRAQGRYTEATLVRELETYGIGRPSTFASLLSVIQDKKYVELKDTPSTEIKVKEYILTPYTLPLSIVIVSKKVGGEKSRLFPTKMGYSVLTFMMKHFEDLFDYRFTAQMEKRLDHVAEGTEVWKSVLKDMWYSYKDRYEILLSNKLVATNATKNVKIFSNGLKAIQSKKGPLLLIEREKEDTQFIGWSSGVSFDDMTEEIALAYIEEKEKKESNNIIGEWNGISIIKKIGKFGEYLQCDKVMIPYVEDEELEKTYERLNIKVNGVLKQYKEYTIRTGQYGPYIIKNGLKKFQCVSLPKNLDSSNLSEKEIKAIYTLGIESKKKK